MKCKICIIKRKEETLFNPSGYKGDWYCKMHLLQEVNRLRKKLIEVD